jgi:fido (protein-threonine AMPylation protein)
LGDARAVTSNLASDEYGQTPLDDGDLAGLRLTYIANRGQLDAAEQANIVAGRIWANASPRTPDRVLDDLFLRQLHRKMFGDVWAWAGKYRKSGKNIGIDWGQIPVAVRNLCEDAKLWCATEQRSPAGDDRADDGRGRAAPRGTGTAPSAPSPTDDAALRFHHQLVLIHPFVNGNGRHARTAADLLIRAMGGDSFTWGGPGDGILVNNRDPVRAAYLSALKRADAGDLRPLAEFARA